MKRLMLWATAVLMMVAAYGKSVTYTADNTSIFPNPERGFITMLEGHLTKSKPYAVKGNESILDNKKSSECMSIVLVHYYLDNFKTKTTLPDEVLNGFDEDMEVLRSKGMKAIIRFSYTNSSDGNDAAWTYVEQHINQYKSHWQANADVIFVFQAGIVGAWGEWYYTQHYGNQVTTMNEARKAVVDALLEAVPSDRCIQLRTPKFKTSYLNSTQPLTAAEAYQNTPKARLAQHNDAFLYDYDNMGTYQDTAKEKPWLAQETLYVPIGGETDITEADKAQQWATYEKTTAEMSRLHWTFIQSGYAETTTNMWRNNGTFDELNRKMGYRYQLVSGTFSDQVEAGSKLSVNLQIRNAGYAPLYNERHAYIVLKGAQTYRILLAADPRTWLPNGVVSTVNEQITVPATIPAGTYQLYLYLPDAYSTIASNPAYAVRFANTNVWDATTGMNNLNATLTVTGGQTPPPAGDAVLLPAILNKANVDRYSDDMTWYNGDYFNFGPDDAPNTDRWAEWQVELRYPGKYIVSENMATGNGTGHSWQLQLLDANDSPVSTYTTESTWAEGAITYEDKWNLTNVAKGVYTLRVQNVMEWGQPKLQYISLQYDGVLPAGIQNPTEGEAQGQAFDILGRPVHTFYQGIVIRNGKKTVQVGQ
ncbi:MAG: DUF4832 domain-containing protein [Paludibacteraceae bacterium]|nr:DUF4832 domain-containing protein [Paludibacteraceae bacterium]